MKVSINFRTFTRYFVMLLLVLLFLEMFNETAFAGKKTEVTNIKAIYEMDSWIGKMYEAFLKEYKLKMPKKINLHFADSKNEFFAIANVKLDLGAVTLQGTIVLSDVKVTPQNRVALLRELIIFTLSENKRDKDKDKIVVEFFKKHGIK